MSQYLDNIKVRQLANLELLAKQVVEGFIIGLHKSPFHGFSVEFAEHRIYNPGEDTKNIDWKVLARTDKMFIKRYEEETNLRCQIIIDSSSSMHFPQSKDSNQKINKIQFTALATAALMNLLKKQRDAYGLSIFDSSVHIHTNTRTNTKHYKLLLGYLDKLITKPTLNITTSAAGALHQIADSIHKRSLVIIFSDMFDSEENPNKLFSALQHLKHAKHEVVLFHVTDHKHELKFDYKDRPYKFVDMESGEEIKIHPSKVKEEYKKQISKKYKDLKDKCIQYRVDFVEADINKGFSPILQQYLVKRTKMRV